MPRALRDGWPCLEAAGGGPLRGWELCLALSPHAAGSPFPCRPWRSPGGSAKPVKPPPGLHRPLVSSLLVVSAPVPPRAVPSPDTLRKFFPELAGPREAQAAGAPVCRVPHASPASMASASLRGPQVMAPPSPALPLGRVWAGPVPQPSSPPRWRGRPSAEGRASLSPWEAPRSHPCYGNPMKSVGVTYPIQWGAGAGLDEGTSSSHWVLHTGCPPPPASGLCSP